MKNVICLIYDEVANVWSSPLVFANLETAKRYFKNLMDKNDNKSDFKLYQYGYCNLEKVLLNEYIEVDYQYICSGSDFIRKED